MQSSLHARACIRRSQPTHRDMTTEQQKLLIQKAIDGDGDALLALFMQVESELHRFVAAKLAQTSRIGLQEDDILQETYIKACKEIGGLRINNIIGLTAWIKAIALNQIRDVARRQATSKRGGDRAKIEIDRERFGDQAFGLAIELTDPGIGTPSTYVARREAIDAIRIALSQLPEDQHQAMQLYYFQLLTLNETALRMNRTSDSVRGLIQRAKKSLRDAMITSSMWLSRKG